MEAARELLDLGADVNVENARGSTPLHFAAAAKERTREMCELLLDAGADSGLSDLQGRLPYEMAESDSIRCGRGAGSGSWGAVRGAWKKQPQATQGIAGSPGHLNPPRPLLPCPSCRQLLDGPDPRMFSCSASGDVAGLRQLFQEVRPSWLFVAGILVAPWLGCLCCMHARPSIAACPAPPWLHTSENKSATIPRVDHPPA